MEYCTGSDLSIYIKNRGRIATLDFEPRPSMFMMHAPQSETRGKVYWPHPATGGLDERVTRSFLGQLGEFGGARVQRNATQQWQKRGADGQRKRSSFCGRRILYTGISSRR
jgi:hypothetical protein